MQTGWTGRLRVALDFCEFVPVLVNLRHLNLTWSHLGPGPAMVLARAVRQLPCLESVMLDAGNDLVAASDAVPGTIADLNWIARRDVFM